MRRLVPIVLATLLINAPAAGAEADRDRVTTWKPLCICRDGEPGGTYITAILKITEENMDAWRKLISEGRLAIGQKAKLVAGVCGTPKMCGTTRNRKTKERVANTPIAGPVTIRIALLINAPAKRKRGTSILDGIYVLDEKWFRVGGRFSIGGRPVK